MNKPSSFPAIKFCHHLTVLQITGIDATTFLHSQFTNDVKNMQSGSIQLQGYCTPKGRLLSVFYLARCSETHYAMVVSRDQIDSLLKRLRMYVLRAKVKFSEPSGAPRIILDPATYLQSFQASGSELARGSLLAINDEHFMGNVGVNIDRYIGWDTSVEKLSDQEIDGSNEWILQECKDGVALIGAESSEQHLPQSINLDLVNGVNFQKGCYPGQEIVARLRYLGKLKQRMLRFSTEANTIPKIGEHLFSNDKKAGTVVSSAQATNSKFIGLAVTHYMKLDWENTRLENGTKVTLIKPPYLIPELESPKMEI